MNENHGILAEKLSQATEILKEIQIDCWLTFTRETAEMGDPCLKLISPVGVVWSSAFIITSGGDRIIIAGKYDADAFEKSGLYTEIIEYIASPRDVLRKVFTQLSPRRIAINFSKGNVAADGLTHGLYLWLRDLLADTPFVDRFVSAEPIVNRLRGRKSKSEIQLITAAIRTTEKLLDEVEKRLKPGCTEREIADFLHERIREKGLGTAWEWEQCPIVNFGPDSPVGHSLPSKIELKPGQIAHIDFGVKQAGYCADLQRVWYARRRQEKSAPESVRKAFQTVLEAIQTAADHLKPGVLGYEIDSLARKVLAKAHYPEYQHALGHQLGRSAHDGGALLGPRWERYGDSPMQPVEATNIFTLELGIQTDAGYVGLEEDVVVTRNGCEFLSKPQTKLAYI
jgi:Xaa-Pro aminopeptidase